jgi:hypothetical protein
MSGTIQLFLRPLDTRCVLSAFARRLSCPWSYPEEEVYKNEDTYRLRSRVFHLGESNPSYQRCAGWFVPDVVGLNLGQPVQARICFLDNQGNVELVVV